MKSAAIEWSEEILEEIFRHTPVGVAITDLHGTILQANDALVAIGGYPREEVIGRTASSFLHADDVAKAETILSRFRDAGSGSGRTMCRLISRSGKTVWVAITVSVVRSRSDEPVCGIAFIEDVGERLEIERELEKTAALYRQVVDDQTEMIVRWTPDGTRTFVNEAYVRYFGFAQADLIGTSIFPLVKDDRTRIEARIRSLTPQSPAGTGVHRVVLRDGSARWTEWTDRAIFDETGAIVMVQSIGRDITDRVETTEALRVSEAKFRRLFEDLPVAAWEVDWIGVVNFLRSQGIRSTEELVARVGTNPSLYRDAVAYLRLLQVNASAMALAGVANVDDFRNWVMRQVPFIDHERLAQAIGPLLFGGADSSGAELTVLNAAGEAREVVSRWTRIRQSESGWRILSIVLDVTRYRQSQNEILRQKERLEQAEELAHVGHWETDVAAGTVTGSVEYWRIHDGVAGGPLTRTIDQAVRAVHPDDRPAREAALRAIAETRPGASAEVADRWEFRIVRPDGTVRWVRSQCFQRTREEAPPLFYGVIEDVTESKIAEDALRRGEAMYRHLFDNLPVAVWQTDWKDALDGLLEIGIETPEQLVAALENDRSRVAGIVGRRKIIHANQNALDLLGVSTPEALMRATWPPNVAPEQLPAFLLTLARVAYGQERESAFELQIVRPDGRSVDVHAVLSSSIAAPGHVISTALDVTEEKRARDALRRSEQRYRHLFHTMPVAVWETDWTDVVAELLRQGIGNAEQLLALAEKDFETAHAIFLKRHVVDANQHALDMFGVPDVAAFDSIGWPPNIEMPEFPHLVRNVLKVVLGNVPASRFEVVAHRTDGTRFDLDTTVSRSESPGRMLSTGVDITNRKKIERDLLHGQFLLERAQKLAHLGSWEISIDRDEVHGSREYWNILDGADTGPSTRRLSDVIRRAHPDDRDFVLQTLSDSHQAFVEGRPLKEVPQEFRIVRDDGSIRIVRGQGDFLRTETGDARAYGTLQDITEVKKAEEAVRRQREELMRADRMISLGILVSGVAHEINNPNQFIMLNAPFLANAWTDIAPAVDHFAREHPGFRVSGMRWAEVKREIPEIIGEIDRGADRIRSIVSELRAFGRESEPAELRPCSLNDIIEGSLRLMSNHIRRATSNFQVKLAAGLPPVRANAQRLEQVIVNLVMNSCQALTRSDAAITVTTAFDRRAKTVVMRVADEGRGISAENLKKIRDPFFTTKRAEGGMGLGLAVCDRIVQEHNGNLSFESEPGRGTTATLSVPAIVDQER